MKKKEKINMWKIEDGKPSIDMFNTKRKYNKAIKEWNKFLEDVEYCTYWSEVMYTGCFPDDDPIYH